MKYALLLSITCTVLFNPSGWFGWMQQPESKTYQIGAWWQIYADGGVLTLQAIIARDPETGLPVHRAKLSFNHEQWATYSCTGCSAIEEEYGCL